MQDKSSNFKDYGKKPSWGELQEYADELTKTMVEHHLSEVKKLMRTRYVLNVLIVLNLLLLAFTIGRYKANEKMQEISLAPTRIVEVQR